MGRLEQLQSPYQTYLDRLAPTTRRSAESRLHLIANILWPGVPAPEARWHELDAGAVKAAWLLGMVSTETWHRAAEVQAPKRHALPAGHWIDDDEWVRLFACIAQDKSAAGGSGLGHLRGAAGLGVPAGSPIPGPLFVGMWARASTMAGGSA
jgi:hypothetical protein